jgi:glycosyltransferase involved in cell wall biosynthesis
MRILTLSYEYPPLGGGGARVARGVAETLAERGHEVEVITSGMAGLPAEEQIGGVRIHRVPCRRQHLHYTTTRELATLLVPLYRKARALHAARPFDLNHTHFALPTGPVSWWLQRRTGLPYVVTAHGSDVPGFNPDRFGLEHTLVRPVWQRILRESAAVTVQSHFLADLIRQHSDVPLEIIPNGYRPVARPERTRVNRVLVVTRIFERKGVQHLLHALPKHGFGWEICVAGDGPYLPVLRELAARLGSPVRFLGFVEGEALHELYETSRVFVFPSVQENFPMVLLEAMAAGLAVVTTDAAGCAPVVADAGLTYGAGDPLELRSALARLLGDEAAIEQFGKRARARVLDFTWSRIAEQFESVFARCARER